MDGSRTVVQPEEQPYLKDEHPQALREYGNEDEQAISPDKRGKYAFELVWYACLGSAAGLLVLAPSFKVLHDSNLPKSHLMPLIQLRGAGITWLPWLPPASRVPRLVLRNYVIYPANPSPPVAPSFSGNW